MIKSWRSRFSTDGRTNASAPFLFVQLAPYHGDKAHGFGGFPCMVEGGSAAGGAVAGPSYGGGLPQQRLVQLAALQLENVGMACTVDLGDAASPYWPGSVHPRCATTPASRCGSFDAAAVRLGTSSRWVRGWRWRPGELPTASRISSPAGRRSRRSNSCRVMRRVVLTTGLSTQSGLAVTWF